MCYRFLVGLRVRGYMGKGSTGRFSHNGGLCESENFGTQEGEICHRELGMVMNVESFLLLSVSSGF